MTGLEYENQSITIFFALTFASAAGFTFPNAKNEPPSIKIFLTLLAKEESLLIA